MTQVTVLVPVLARPRHVAPLVHSLAESLTETHASLLFACTPGDVEEIAAIDELEQSYFTFYNETGRGDWAKKINEAAWHLPEASGDWFLLGADDLLFHPGWVDAALAKHTETGALVIGTNDLGNPLVTQGEHSCHPFVHRDYLMRGSIDDRSRPLHEGYWHNWVDNEFICTAKSRGQWAFASDSVVEHLHWVWGKAEYDEVYEVGSQHFSEDEAHFHSRKHLWETT